MFRLLLTSIIFGLIVLTVFPCAAQASFAINVQTIREMPSAERCQTLLSWNMYHLDSATFVSQYTPLQDLAVQTGDRKMQWLLKYFKFKKRAELKLPLDQIFALLSDLETSARAENWPVERMVAQHYQSFEAFYAKKIGYEQLYAYILDEFPSMKALGLEQFRAYEVPDLMYHSAQFLFELEDYDNALQFLLEAERFLDPQKTRYHTMVLTLNYIQTIYQQQKNYPEGIRYAQKILKYSDSLWMHYPKVRERYRFWQGLSTIDIAWMLVQQQKYAEGERFADQGYALTKVTNPGNESQMEGEFDALMPLLSIKIELKKIAETDVLIRRADEIWQQIGHKEFNYFKSIRLWQAHARLAEIKGDFATSVRYERIAKPLQDSLDRRTDARKLEKIQQRIEAQKYTEKIRLIESEKQIQTTLRNVALLLLLLVIGLAYYNYLRLQRKRRQDLRALEAAQGELETYIQNFLEKSELAENLRLEITQFSTKEERSQHLKELMQSTILTEQDWTQFRALFEKVYPDFIYEQKTSYPDITQAELRYLVLEKLQLNTTEMARMLGVSDGTIRQTRSRLRKKINSSYEL